MQKSGSVKGKLLLLFIAVAWGSSMVVIKGSTDFIPPGMLLALRFTIASIILAIIYRKKNLKTDCAIGNPMTKHGYKN